MSTHDEDAPSPEPPVPHDAEGLGVDEPQADAPEVEAPEADVPATEESTADESSSEAQARGAESPSATSEQSTRGGPGPLLRGASWVLLLLIGGCFGGIVVRGIMDVLSPEEPPPAEVIEIQPTPDVITAMRDLARLEGASFHVERVVDLQSRQTRLFGLVEARDSILLVAAADVVAGVDLSRLEDGDVLIEDGRRVTITMPPVEIFSARLDNDRTYVYARNTDTLAQRRENLETRARREAERTLRAAAIEGGIRERAERNVEATVSALIGSLGFDAVVIDFRPPGAE